MVNQEIFIQYQQLIGNEQSSRGTLRQAVLAIENDPHKYSSVGHQESARRVLDNVHNGLSPSEESFWNDRLRRAYR